LCSGDPLPGFAERSNPTRSTPLESASNAKNLMEDLAEDCIKNGKKPAYKPATPLAFIMARVASRGDL
jgi:hypothetical protein